MFDKILIANRGEIAIRIAHTAKRMGITCVAVYSTADRNSLHVEACDEAYNIGAGAAADSYLRADKILEVARQSGAQAIHPGYGFLSENAEFASSCEQAGIVFIGPSASAIAAMGSKIEARALMQAAGLPLVPGYHGDTRDNQILLAESRLVGYPQILKPSAGGGGKGMHLVWQAEEFMPALESARREAKSSFNDDRILIERYLNRARHVEIQVFADNQGHCIHLFERDCSIQRRHQKILEESPAPGIDQGLRKQMAEAALNCVREIKYVGAGTVEFLLDQQGRFYFMEMNTRLQVEHPVTEMITGLDLVEWQLQVAAGHPLPKSQQQVSIEGHALEVRIYAEWPARDFMPSSGRIEYLSVPETSPSIRIDSGVGIGDDIGSYYDPMIAKLIVFGENRDQAIAKMRRALLDYQLLGLQTNIAFLSRLVSSAAFANAELDTGFIEQHRAELFIESTQETERALLIAAAALIPDMPGNPGRDLEFEDQSPWALKNSWRMNLPAIHRIRLIDDNADYQLKVLRLVQGWQIEINNSRHLIDGKWLDHQCLQLELDNQRITVPVVFSREAIALWYLGHERTFKYYKVDRGEAPASTESRLSAPMSGEIVALVVTVGDRVQPGDVLAVIEAMKMEHSIVAGGEAIVSEIFFDLGDQVEEGDLLLSLDQQNPPQ